MTIEKLTSDQITWENVFGNREVKRLPPHFATVFYTFSNVDILGSPFNFHIWNQSEYKFKKGINLLREHIEQTFSGRYFIDFYGGDNFNIEAGLAIGFEDHAEASFFTLQIDSLINNITEILRKKNN